MGRRIPPFIYTKRLVLSLPRTADIEELLAYGVRNREHLAPWSPPPPKDAYTISASTRLVERIAREFNAGQSVRFSLRLGSAWEGKFVGAVSLGVITLAAFRACYLGYHVDREYEGRGYMTEAVSAVVRYAFEELKLHRVMANYMPHNLRSERLLERLGFVKEGYAKEYLFIGGKWQDHVMTALVNHQLAGAEELMIRGV